MKRGAKAENYADDQDTDLEGPCDLVFLKEDDGDEVEIDRKEFDSGKEASVYLGNIFKRED